MAFTDLGSIASGGSSGNNQASLTVATTASCSAGELVVVAVSVDNRATGGGDDTATSGVVLNTSGGSLVLTLTKGRQNATNLAAQAGASVSLWYGVLPSSYASGGNIVASFTTAASADATALSARHFSFTSGATLSVEATNAGTSTTTNPGSLNATTANLPCLRIRAIGCEWDSTQTLTVTGSWTAWAEGASAASGTLTEQVIEAEHRISTGTGDASAPTLGSACDSASVYVAFKEVYALTAANGSYSLTGSDAALTATTSTEYLPAAADWFNPWGSRRLPPDTVWPNQCLYGVSVTPPDTDNLPAGGANWFNPWGPRRGNPYWTWFSALHIPQPVTLTAAGGSYTLTGASAAQAFGQAAASGSYTLTGSAAGQAFGHVAGSGAYTLTGSAAALALGHVAGAGSYALTGSAAALALGHVAGAGSYSLTGSNADLALGLGAGAGSYTITGTAAGLVIPGGIAAAAGSYTLTGSDAGLTVTGAADNLPTGVTNWFNPWRARYPVALRTWIGPAPPTATYIFRQPLITRIWSRPQRQDWIWAVGFQAEVVGNVVLTAGAGSYTITGSAVALALGQVAGAGSYALSGSAAALATRLGAGAGAYVLTGSAASLALGHAAGAGAYTVTGATAGFAFGNVAGAGSYNLTGADAQLRQAGTIAFACEAGSYTLTGGAEVSFIGVIPPTVEQPGGGYAGVVVGAGRGRMIRRRKRGELDLPPDLEPPPPGPQPPDLPPPAPGPRPPDLLPPQPGLMADMPTPQHKPLPPVPDDEDEDEIALLIELLDRS